MSLIQEALRRQQEEQSGDGDTPAPPDPPPAGAAATPPPATGAAPSLPRPPGAPLPPPPARPAGPPPSPAAAAASPTAAPESDAKGSRPWGSMVGIIAVVLIIVGALVGLMLFANKKMKDSRDSRTLAVNAPSQTGPEDDAGPSQGDSSLPGMPATQGTDDGTAAAKPPSDTTQSTATSTGEPTPGTGDSTATAATVDTGTSDTSAAQAPVQPADWPELSLTGVVGKGIRGAATLNGQIVAVGETIEGAEVVYIGDEGVKLEFDAESRYVRVGQKID